MTCHRVRDGPPVNPHGDEGPSGVRRRPVFVRGQSGVEN